MSGLRILPRLLLLGLLLKLPLRAQEDPKVVVDAAVASHRIDRGVVESGNAAVGSVELSRSGWRGRLEAGQALRSGDPGNIALEAGYAWQFGAPTIEAGVVARERWFTGIPTGATRHDTELGVTLGRAGEDGFRPSLTYLRDLRRQGNTLEVAVAQEWPLTQLGAYLEGRIIAGWRNASDLRPDASGPKIHDSYGYAGAGLRLPYRIGAFTTLVVGGEVTGTTGQNAAWSPIGHSGGVVATGRIGVSFDF